MATDYYSKSGWPATSSQAASSDARAEMALIEAGFGLLPDLTGVANRIPHINAGSTAIITTSGFTFDGTTLSVAALTVSGAVALTGAVSVIDGSFSIKGSSDATKIAKFEVDGFTTGTTRTFTLPDVSDTVVTLGATQTLTAKTLTSPTINTPTINTVASVGGSWTAAATWTLPALTLGGTVTSNGQSFSGTIANLGTVTTADINGGTLDGVTIGGASAAAATVTTLTASGAVQFTAAGTALAVTNNVTIGGRTLLAGAVDDGGAKLQIAGYMWVKEAAAAKIYFRSDFTAGVAGVQVEGAYPLALVTNNVERMRVNADGTGITMSEALTVSSGGIAVTGNSTFVNSVGVGGASAAVAATIPISLANAHFLGWYDAGTSGAQNCFVQASGGVLNLGTGSNTRLSISVVGVVTFSAGATIASGTTLTLTETTVDGAPTWSSTQSLNTSGTAAIATTVTAADTASATCSVALFEAATGNVGPKTDAGLTYNATTGVLTATGFSGPLTGNVTGNCSGTAATVTGAAQAAITSVGTLAALATGAISAYINDTSNANMTTGLTINQGAADDAILAFKSSDVAHGITTYEETDTYGVFMKSSATLGGLHISGLTSSKIGISLLGMITTEDTTKATNSQAAHYIQGTTKSGTTTAQMGANANIMAVNNGAFTRFILDTDGDSHQDVGTAWTNFDHLNDIATLDALAYNVARADDPIKRKFGEWMLEKRPELERHRIVTFNDDGHHFVNMSKLTMLNTGAIRQLAEMFSRELETRDARIEQLESKLLL